MPRFLQQMTPPDDVRRVADRSSDRRVCNRRAFDDSLRVVPGPSKPAAGDRFSMAMLDIDFFKQVNDEQGHLQGDRVLQDLAELLRDERSRSRHRGSLWRRGIRHPDAAHRAGRRLQFVRAAAGPDPGELPITVSIGSGRFGGRRHHDQPAGSRADAALYLAKGAGRNCVYFHEGPPGRIVGIRVASTDAASQSGARKTQPPPRRPALTPQWPTTSEPWLPQYARAKPVERSSLGPLISPAALFGPQPSRAASSLTLACRASIV